METYSYPNSRMPVTVIREQNGNRILLFPNDLEQQTKDLGAHYADVVRNGSYEEITKTKPDTWTSEADRLCDIIRRISGPEPEINLFQYLPATKSGSFPKKNILIASTKCATGAAYDGYVTGQRMQMRLIPAYADEMDWLHNKPIPEALLLSVGMFDSTKKTEPVFDYEGNPHFVKNTPAKYLKNDQIKQGYLYEEKSGSQYLYLNGADIDYGYTVLYADGSKAEHTLLPLFPKGYHIYLRWSAALEKRLNGDTSLANIVATFAGRETTEDHIFAHKLSKRANPRKFVKEIRQIYDPNTVTDITIDGMEHPYYGNIESVINHYHIKGPNK